MFIKKILWLSILLMNLNYLMAGDSASDDLSCPIERTINRQDTLDYFKRVNLIKSKASPGAKYLASIYFARGYYEFEDAQAFRVSNIENIRPADNNISRLPELLDSISSQCMKDEIEVLKNGYIIESMEFTPDNSALVLLLSSKSGFEVLRYELFNKTKTKLISSIYPNYPNAKVVRAKILSPDCTYIVLQEDDTCSSQYTFWLQNIKNEREPNKMIMQCAKEMSVGIDDYNLKFSPDGNFLVVQSRRGNTFIKNLNLPPCILKNVILT